MKLLSSSEIDALNKKRKKVKEVDTNKILIFVACFTILAIFYFTRPIKLDIIVKSSTDVKNVLTELELDFDLVTNGATCLSGTQKHHFDTEKYGILYTEFTYCKNNGTTILRVYNDSKDQLLRNPFWLEN